MHKVPYKLHRTTLVTKRRMFHACLSFGLACIILIPLPTAVVRGQDTLPSGEITVPALPDHLNSETGMRISPSEREIATSDNIVASRRLLEIIRSGGPLMVPIGVCSIILLIFVFERAIALRKGRIIPGPFSRRFIEQLKDGELNREEAIALCEKNGSPVADVFKAGALKWGRPAVEIEQAIMDAGERVSSELRKYLRLINGIATVCPLLGLLGTVLGMIHAFDAIATATSTADPKTLIATGISQALLTTAAGMSVAIPAITAYLFFVGRVDRRIMELDSLGQQFVNYVAIDSGSATSRRSKSSTKAA